MDYLWAQKKLAPLLRPLSFLYATCMSLRAGAYSAGLLPSLDPGVFCVSLGNISWGGSGKTPMAGWMLRWAAERGLTPAVLSRGYGGRNEERPLLVKPWTSPEAAGDEPLMLAQAHPQACILADPSRRRALGWLKANSRADFIIMDDAMQHLTLRRHVNLTLLLPEDLGAGWGRVIPLGSWREGPKALERADAFMLRVSPEESEELLEIARERLPEGKPVFAFDLVPVVLSALEAEPGGDGTEYLRGRDYALATAVGNPASVRRGLTLLLGRPPAREFIFPDHYFYKAADLCDLRRSGLPIATTVKDAVKIRTLLSEKDRCRYFVLESELHFGRTAHAPEDFAAWFARAWQNALQ
ncbi:MAG: tetraacyldisaccharide 4'-kinase [Desulfovibrionaceae bacterium]|nr:tetraacyldisaccharide 4'-kinase [Desulfovibrionaceae bacterium]